jgi:hypothetical protein
MFAIFTRLTRDEGALRTESLLPLILGVAAFFVLTVLTGSAARGCQPAAGPHAAATAGSSVASQRSDRRVAPEPGPIPPLDDLQPTGQSLEKANTCLGLTGTFTA